MNKSPNVSTHITLTLSSPVPVLLFFWLCLTLASCSPRVHSFQVDQQTITAADSLRVNWEVSGKPTLLIHEKEVADAKYMELTLVAQKRGKEARQFIQVVVLPPQSVDTVVFRVSDSLHGDTLLAAGEKNIGRWGDHFRLGGVASASGRPLWVTHGGRTVLLDGAGTDTEEFQGLVNSGLWEIRAVLTDAEKRDHTIILPVLRLRTNLIYHKR